MTGQLCTESGMILEQAISYPPVNVPTVVADASSCFATVGGGDNPRLNGAALLRLDG